MLHPASEGRAATVTDRFVSERLSMIVARVQITSVSIDPSQVREALLAPLLSPQTLQGCLHSRPEKHQSQLISKRGRGTAVQVICVSAHMFHMSLCDYSGHTWPHG